MYRYACAAALLLAVACTESSLSQPLDGAHSVSLSRFAMWPPPGAMLPTDAPDRHYEGDLVKQVFADRIMRSHKGLMTDNWVVQYGAYDKTLDPDSVDPAAGAFDVRTTDINWIRKRFAVDRRLAVGGTPLLDSTDDCGAGTTYTVTVNSVAPGTWIESDYSMLYVRNKAGQTTRFTHVAYVNPSSQFVAESLADGWAKTSAQLSASNTENFVLLWGEQNGSGTPSKNTIIPLMLSFSSGIEQIQQVNGVVRLEFSGTGPNVMALSLPFGVDGFPGPAGSWFNAATHLPHCSKINSLVCNRPETVAETFTETPFGDPTHIEITNTFTVATMPGALPLAYTTLPPLVAFARDHAHLDQGGLVSWTFQEEDLGYPTKYGPLYWQSASNSSSYQIPIVSPHDGHFVPHAGSSENRVWAQRLLNIIHSSEDVRQVRSGAFSSMNNRGEFAALGMLTPNQRQAFLDRMRDTILIRMTESGPTNQEIPLDPAYTIGKQLIDPRQQWRYFDVESEDCVAVPEAFASCLWRAAGHPFDLDASAGTVLEYIYEYVLWSGDTALLASLWNGELNGPGDLSIDAIFDGVRLFHDWATMGSSHDPWGDDGSANDMAMAQYAALKSYARLAEFQGESDKAAFGRYLTAKYQIPQALRWVFLEGWVADYYKTISPEFFSNAGSYSAVLRGIGELEPSGPLRHRNHGYLEEWSDWTVSGERLHLGPYDVYRALLDDSHVSAGEQPPFGRMVESMYAGYPTPSADADGIRGAFPEAKFYAFWRNADVASLSLLPQSAAAAQARMGLQHTPAVAEQSVQPIPLYQSVSVSPSEWYPGVDQLGTLTPNTPEAAVAGSSALYPAMLESYDVPVLVGGWNPGVVESLEYDASVGVLTVGFVEPLAADTPLVLSLREGGGVVGDPVWNRISASASIGSSSYQHTGFSTGSTPAAAAEPNLLLDGDFEGLGVGRANSNQVWTTVRGQVLPYPGESNALKLDVALPGQESPKAHAAAHVGTDQEFTIRFRYRVTNHATTLSFGYNRLDRRSCDGSEFSPDTMCRDYSGFWGTANGSLGVNELFGSPNDDHWWSTDWTTFEVRDRTRSGEAVMDPETAALYLDGLWSNDPTKHEGVVRTQFTLNGSPSEGAVWIDDVEILAGPPVGFPQLTHPPEGFSTTQASQWVPIRWWPDHRVVQLADDGSMPGTGLAAGEYSVRFQYTNDWDDPNPTWTDIPKAEVNTGQAMMKARIKWTFPSSGVSGKMRIRAQYFDDTDTEVGTAESGVFEILELVTFTDVSAESQIASGLTSVEQGTASLAFDFAGDGGGADLLVGMEDKDLHVFVNQGPEPGKDHATFVDERLTAFLDDQGAQSPPPINVRGLSCADIDNDLDEDLFLALGRHFVSPTVPVEPWLVESHKAQGTGSELQLTTHLPSGLTDAWAGAFGHIDPGGRVDLYVARCDAAESTVAAFDAATGLPDVLLVNQTGAGGGFADAIASGAAQFTSSSGVDLTGPSKTIAAQWVYADEAATAPTKKQDLYVAWLGTADSGSSTLAWSPLFVNQGDVGGGVVGFEDRAGAAIAPRFGRMGSVTDVRFADYDSDGYADISLARQVPGAGQQNLLICLNEGSLDPGDLTFEPSFGLNSTVAMRTLEVADLDDNQKVDVVAVPVDPADPLEVFYGYPSDTHPQEVQYFERAAESGLSHNKARSITAADLNSDGDTDLFLVGEFDPNSPSGFYFANGRAQGGGAPSNNGWVNVRVVGNATTSPAGAVVTLTTLDGSHPQVQSRSVDGGGGRVQSAGPMGFGVGDATQAVLQVTYPDGVSVGFGSVPLNGPEVVVEPPHTPLIIASSITSNYTTDGTGAAWTFEFDTHGTSHLDRIVFPGKAPAGCDNRPADKDITSGEPGVTWSVTEASPGIYHHVLTWEGASCLAPCTYNYTIESTYGSSTDTSATQQFTVSVCGGFQQ